MRCSAGSLFVGRASLRRRSAACQNAFIRGQHTYLGLELNIPAPHSRADRREEAVQGGSREAGPVCRSRREDQPSRSGGGRRSCPEREEPGTSGGRPENGRPCRRENSPKNRLWAVFQRVPPTNRTSRGSRVGVRNDEVRHGHGGRDLPLNRLFKPRRMVRQVARGSALDSGRELAWQLRGRLTHCGFEGFRWSEGLEFLLNFRFV